MTRSVINDLFGGASQSIVQPRWTTWWMLYSKRWYVIDKIKKPLMKAITVLAMRYPEPTKDHTLQPNTHVWIDIRDKFFEHEDNAGRDALFKAMWRMFIIEYEHDPYYRDRLDWIIGELVEAVKNGKWKSGRRPIKYWNER